jgi:hypothetical protein
LCILAVSAFSQRLPEKGMPLIENFKPQDYLNKGKIWGIASAPNGMVYMAADKGLLEYDGQTWHCFKGSNGSTRSLLVVNDSVIYTGSDLDFGIWKRDKNYAFQYTSLYPFQQDIKDVNEEFWGVHLLNNSVLFVSFNNVYVYKNLQLTKIPATSRFTGSFTVNDSVYFADENAGIYVFSNISLKKIFQYPQSYQIEISGLYQNKNDWILVTKKSGLFTYSNGALKPIITPLSKKLADANVFCFKQISPQYLAFGTVLKGLFITDLTGNVIHHITKKKGLPNNTILSLHEDAGRKLWLGLDQGISVIDLNNEYTFFNDYLGDFGTGYTACLKDDWFYLGTNQGLYQSKWNELNNNAEYNHFKLIPETEGQVWSIRVIDNTLFIGHDKGLFTFNGKTLHSVSNEPGFWTITPYQSNYLLTGNYNGISIFKKENNAWTFVKKMELILGSCNQILIQDGSILWVTIPNFGIIRAVLDENLFPVQRQIMPESDFEGENPCLMKVGNEIMLLTDKCQYRYNNVIKHFIKTNDRAPHTKIDDLITQIHPPDTISPDYTFHSIYNGFAFRFLNNEQDKSDERVEVVFRKLEGFNNEQNNGFPPGAELPFQLNNIRIEWIVPNRSDVMYQFKTKETEDWGKLSSSNTLEMLNLKPGKHTIMVRAFYHGQFTNSNEITCYIAAPLYRTKYAYALYFVLFVIAIILLYSRQKQMLKKQRQRLLQKKELALKEQAEQHNREVIALEKEMLKSEYDVLKQQLKNKTIELANKAKDNDEKKQLLLAIKEKFEHLQNEPTQTKIRLGEIKRLLDSHLNVEDHTFEIQIDELHQGFFKKLKVQFPQISTQDLRLCAYLKIGLNTNEIAEILNILPSSVFVSRSRLRKKLNLQIDQDINSFLNNI